METSRLFFHLGFSSIAQYAERHFKLSHSQTYDLIRVAKALPALPLCDQAFKSGEISWSVLREITKVATQESEAEWLQFARSGTLKQIHAEVKEALKKKRTRPRQDGFGLPNVTEKLAFEMPAEEHDLVSKALEKAAREMALGLGEGGHVEPKDALLYMARRLLETDLAEAEGVAPRELREREESIFTILYLRCPVCRRAQLPTADGPIEIPAETVERVEGEAEVVKIAPEEERSPRAEPASPQDKKPVPPAERDRPNTALLVKKVLLRDGGVCSNPHCRRRIHLHAHHLEFRIHGGRTVLSNSAIICRWCHSLLHLGLLRVEGDPFRGLIWRAKNVPSPLDFSAELKELASAPEIRLEVKGSAASPAASRDEASESTRVDSPRLDSKRPAPGFAMLLKAMEKIGFAKGEALQRLKEAWLKLSSGTSEPAENEILREAIRG